MIVTFIAPTLNIEDVFDVRHDIIIGFGKCVFRISSMNSTIVVCVSVYEITSIFSNYYLYLCRIRIRVCVCICIYIIASQIVTVGKTFRLWQQS